MTWVVFGVAVVVVLGLIIAACNKALRSSRRGVSSGIGDGLGNFIDVFDPGQARAQRDLKHEEHKGPVTPSPDDEDDPVRLVHGPDGRPRAVRIKRPG